MKDIYRETRNTLTQAITDLGEPAYRAGQVYDWLHKHQAASFSEMGNVPKTLKEKLSGVYQIPVLKTETVLVSKIEDTRKFLFSLEDHNLIEGVLMSYHHGYSACISTQVGCRMGCKFCASTLDGLTRNLTAGEMLAEVYAMRREAKSRIDSLVLMGCGEPLDNYEEVMTFLRRLSDPEGYGLSLRNVTLSTCGLVPQIYRLAKEGLPITLAISLHAPDDELRRVTMPVANRYSIEEILQACAVYFEKTGRRITFEYALVKGLNDGKEQALTLAKRLTSLKLSGKTVPCHVNLIPVNPVKERGLLRTEKQEVFRFQELLKKNGVNATIRREMGQDIDGACGQLRQNRKSLLTNCNNCVTE